MGTRYYDQGRQALEGLGFDPDDEDEVLRALAEPIREIPREELDKMDLADAIVLSLSAGNKHFFAVEILGQTGTEKSVAALKNCLSSKNQDIRSSAVAALARILGDEGREICIQALEDPSFKNNADILRVIRDHDGGEAVPAVMQRMKRIIPRGRDNDRDSEGLTEINLALDYLRRIRAEELRELQALVWEHWEKLGGSTCSWIAQNMPEIMPGPETPVLSIDEFLKKIEKLKFFDGFTPEAARKAKALIRKNHKQGLRGTDAKYYRRFPGFALIFLSIDGEWDDEPYEPLVREFAKASFGMFAPKKIKDVRNEDETATLSFEVEGATYQATAENQGGWIPTEFLELIEKAFKKHTNGLQFFETLYPEAGQSATWTFCKPKAYRALVKAGLLPAEAQDASSIE